MDGDLTALERKLDLLLENFQQLREENHALKEHLARTQSEKQSLSDKIDVARVRLEALMARLPEEQA